MKDGNALKLLEMKNHEHNMWDLYLERQQMKITRTLELNFSMRIENGECTLHFKAPYVPYTEPGHIHKIFMIVPRQIYVD